MNNAIMTEEEYKKKLDELDEKVHEIYEESFNKPYPEGWKWYNNHPLVKERRRLYREYKLVKTPVMSPQDELDKECLMKFKDFKQGCEIGPMFTDYDGDGRYATKNEVSDIYVNPSDITSGVYRKDFEYICWYNK